MVCLALTRVALGDRIGENAGVEKGTLPVMSGTPVDTCMDPLD
jgi:hypothetical protein